MPKEFDQKVDSPDNGYNGQMRLVGGTIQLGMGAGTLPLDVPGGRVFVTYSGVLTGNEGFLTAVYDSGSKEIVVGSSNALDDNLVQFLLVTG